MTIAIYNEQLLSYFLFNTKLFTPHPLWGTWTHKSSSLCGLLFHHNLHRGCSSAFASASIRGCWVLTRQRLVEDRKSKPVGRVVNFFFQNLPFFYVSCTFGVKRGSMGKQFTQRPFISLWTQPPWEASDFWQGNNLSSRTEMKVRHAQMNLQLPLWQWKCFSELQHTS